MDLSVVLTFHAEGANARPTMLSVQRSLERLVEYGLEPEVICVLDAPDEATGEAVTALARRNRWLTIETAFRDPGLTRNRGVAESRGNYVAIQDGDDYMSRDWLVRAYQVAALATRPVVLHPEFALGFGDSNHFLQHISQAETGFRADSMLMFNPWKVQVVAHRSVFVEVPYLPRAFKGARFNYEDWHWQCETLGRGIRHEIVPQTAIFYRVSGGGTHSRDLRARETFGPTTLFSPQLNRASERREARQ